MPPFPFSPKLFAITALIPLLFGFIWYNPKVFGKAWMQSAGITEESMKGANMFLVFGLTYVFSFLLSAALDFTTIHQTHLFSLAAPQGGAHEPTPEMKQWLMDSMEKTGTFYRSFKHGALHGIIFSVLALLPIIGINALFERRGAKYIFINWGFWALCCTVMGAIICQYAGTF